ncbi:hypothetical protein Bca4012_010740 [Brassica carinata]
MQLRKFNHLQALANINFKLPDEVGKIRSRQDSDLNNSEATPRDSATFVVSAREMTKRIKKEAASLALEECGGEMELPKCLEDLPLKEYVFQLPVTPYNFTPKHRTITVSAISEDPLFGTEAESGSSNQAAIVDVKSGLATESAYYTGDAAKISLE